MKKTNKTVSVNKLDSGTNFLPPIINPDPQKMRGKRCTYCGKRRSKHWWPILDTATLVLVAMICNDCLPRFLADEKKKREEIAKKGKLND
jgi:hypothetical protein